jgi:hypothetical protein
MRSAIYYPHTQIPSESLLKTMQKHPMAYIYELGA